MVAAGFEAHLAEPADTQAARGRKRRAKTDRSDYRLLRELLQDGRLPASWIAPTIVLEWRERARLYVAEATASTRTRLIELAMNHRRNSSAFPGRSDRPTARISAGYRRRWLVRPRDGDRLALTSTQRRGCSNGSRA